MNPFEKLLALIETWEQSGGNTASRRLGEGAGVGRWEPLREAFTVMLEVDELLTEEGSELLLDSVWEYFMQIDKSWTGNNRSGNIADSDVEHLRSLSRSHKVSPLASPDLGDAEVESLRNTLELIKQELEEFSGMLGNAGTRLVLLVESCLILLEQDHVDSAAVRAKAEQIVGAAATVGEDLPEENRVGFWKKLGDLLRPWMRDASSNAAGNVLSDVITNLQLPPAP